MIATISFNPRTREGANAKRENRQVLPRVSIHAPVKVRTFRAGN